MCAQSCILYDIKVLNEYSNQATDVWWLVYSTFKYLMELVHYPFIQYFLHFLNSDLRAVNSWIFYCINDGESTIWLIM